MLLNDGRLPSILFFCLLICATPSRGTAQQQPASKEIVCPAILEVNESILPIPGWNTTPARQQHKFERISIFNGTPGDKEFELAPDDEKQQGTRVTQTWSLKDYRTMNIFLRCRYHDTPVVVYKDLPAEIRTCTLRFSTDKKGTIIGQSDMICR